MKNIILTCVSIFLVVALGSGCTCVGECEKTSKKTLQAKICEWRPLFEKEVIGKYSTTVFSRGSGPPILLMHELPGLTPDTIELAMELSETHRVYMPLFFGKFGGRLSHDLQASVAFIGSRKWKLFDSNDLGPIREEMKALVREISQRNGGEKVVTIGNCLTGSISFELLGESCVDQAIVCQPAVPILPWARKKLALDEPSIQKVGDHMSVEKRLYIFHYLNDRAAPIERSAEMVRRIETNGRSQSDVFLGVEADATVDPEIFRSSNLTTIVVSKDSRHSTITGASAQEVSIEGHRACESDRAIFRKYLQSILNP